MSDGNPKRTGGTYQVLIAGEAGQGVVIQGILLAEAAVASGAWVAQAARYGAAMRGGIATADVVISDQPIDFPQVEDPDYLIAISQVTYEKFAMAKKSIRIVVYDPFFVTPKELEGVVQIGIAATDVAIKTFGGAQASNLIILGALAEVTGLITEQNIVEAIDRNLETRFRENNLRAFDMGRQMARAAGKES